MTEQSKRNWAPSIVAVAALVALVVVGLVLYGGTGESATPRGSSDYGWLREYTVTLAGTGVDGAVTASGTTDGPVRGHVYALHVDYGDTAEATTDLTITLASPALTVLQTTDYYTDTWYYPAVEQAGSAGSGTSTYDRLPVSGYLAISAGEAVSGTIATVTIWYGE